MWLNETLHFENLNYYYINYKLEAHRSLYSLTWIKADDVGLLSYWVIIEQYNANNFVHAAFNFIFLTEEKIKMWKANE